MSGWKKISMILPWRKNKLEKNSCTLSHHQIQTKTAKLIDGKCTTTAWGPKIFIDSKKLVITPDHDFKYGTWFLNNLFVIFLSLQMILSLKYSFQAEHQTSYFKLSFHFGFALTFFPWIHLLFLALFSYFSPNI
jgi:hypothetical protein